MITSLTVSAGCPSVPRAPQSRRSPLGRSSRVRVPPLGGSSGCVGVEQHRRWQHAVGGRCGVLRAGPHAGAGVRRRTARVEAEASGRAGSCRGRVRVCDGELQLQREETSQQGRSVSAQKKSRHSRKRRAHLLTHAFVCFRSRAVVRLSSPCSSDKLSSPSSSLSSTPAPSSRSTSSSCRTTAVRSRAP
jgi:hypothetical protein